MNALRAVLLLLLAGCAAGDLDAGAHFVPTPVDVVRFMLSRAQVSRDDVLFDLGSGDGNVLRVAARDFHCRAVGVEIDPDLVQSSRKMIDREKLGDLVRIVQGDLLKADLGEASVVTLYLGEGLNRQLLPKLRELRAGTRIVSHGSPLPGVAADVTESMVSRDDGLTHVVYVYVSPLR